MEFPCLFDQNGRWTGGVSFASCGAHVIIEAATLHSLNVVCNLPTPKTARGKTKAKTKILENMLTNMLT